MPAPGRRRGSPSYTDGACSGNPGRGGWAWAVAPSGTPSASGGEARTTNQRMEIQAVLEAVRALAGRGRGRVGLDLRRELLPGPLVGEAGSAKGWINSQRKPVANRDLWEPLIDARTAPARTSVTFRWVKGHSGDPMNDLVDRLAVEQTVPVILR